MQLGSVSRWAVGHPLLVFIIWIIVCWPLTVAVSPVIGVSAESFAGGWFWLCIGWLLYSAVVIHKMGVQHTPQG